MKPPLPRWRALVNFPSPGGEPPTREFIVYAMTHRTAMKRLREGRVCNLNPQTSALTPEGTVPSLGGTLVELAPYPDMPKGVFLVDRAPSRETRS